MQPPDYYVRAYATNSAGTGFGNTVTFRTTADANQVTFTYNGATVTYGVITSPVTGRKWLDRNLGASQVATAYDRFYGLWAFVSMGTSGRWAPVSEFQLAKPWQRCECKDKDIGYDRCAGHSSFITPDNTVQQNGVWVYDWRSDQNTNRWAINSQGACPTGWHVPTAAEWDAETGITNLATAFSQLKLTAAGFRYGDFDGSGREGTVRNVGAFAYYWSSSVWPSGKGFSSYKDISSNSSNMDLIGRAYGIPVRCIKD